MSRSITPSAFDQFSDAYLPLRPFMEVEEERIDLHAQYEQEEIERCDDLRIQYPRATKFIEDNLRGDLRVAGDDDLAKLEAMLTPKPRTLLAKMRASKLTFTPYYAEQRNGHGHLSINRQDIGAFDSRRDALKTVARIVA